MGSHHYGGGGRNYNKKPLVPLLCALPRISAPVSIPPDAIRHLPHPLVPLPLCLPRISAPVSIPPWRIALTWQFEREEPRGAMLRPRLLSGISRILPRAIKQTTLPFLTGLFHSHPRFYSPGMGSSEPLLISPVLPPNPTLAQIIVCGIISAFSTTGCLYIFFIIIIVCFDYF